MLHKPVVWSHATSGFDPMVGQRKRKEIGLENKMKKILLGMFGVALMATLSGCVAEGGYGGVYGGVGGEYPDVYYGAPVYTYPYPYHYHGPYDRDHYWDRDRHWERHRW